MIRVNKIGHIEVDATISEDHSHQWEVTQNPVEGSAPVADHIIEQPYEFVMTGVITNSPIVQGLELDLREGVERRAESGYMELVALASKRQPVTVETSLGSLSDMAIASIAVQREVDIGDAVQFTARLVKVKRVGIAISALPPVKQQIGRPKADRGKQPSTPVDKSTTLWRFFFAE